VLAGNPAQTASAVLQGIDAGPVDQNDIVQGHLLTRLFVALTADATVGQVNAAAESVGATAVAFSGTDSLLLTLQIPRQIGIGDLHRLARLLRVQPGIQFAWPAREFKTSVLPELPPGQPISPLNLSHLLPTRFPQAWNARGAAAADCLPRLVDVYVWDKFGDSGSRPTFFSQIDSNGFVSDDVGLESDEAGHGFDVASTLGAAFDAQKPTGANPFTDCQIIHEIEAFGRDHSEAMGRALAAVKGETDSRFILNISMNFAETFCGPNGDQICDAQTIHTTPLEILRGEVSLRVLLAGEWARVMSATSLGEKMLISLSAGNVDPEPNGFLAHNYRGFRSASFSSPVSLATQLGQLSSLLSDASLWRSETDPTLPDITFPTDIATQLVDLLAQGGVPPNGISADNLLIVDSATDAEAFADVRASEFNFLGADVRAVGENVKLFDVPLVNGSSFTAPQVAGLASYLWVLSDPLRNLHPSFTVNLIKQTSRTSGNSQTVPVIDAYAAIQFLDVIDVPLGGPDGRIRKALLDVNDDGVFDHLDLLRFQNAYQLTDPNRPTIPISRDYSRFDLNGDGFTGGVIIERFELEVGGTAPSSVTVPIEGFNITMNEAALSDIQILCFYAYSDLYATSPVNPDEALRERTRILGADHCVGARLNALFPAQISGSASLDITVEVPTGNGQFAPAANLLVELTPTCANVDSSSGRTDANGRLSTTITPIGGCVALSIQVVARAEANTTPLVQSVVTASIGAGLLSGDLALTDVNFPGGITFDPLNINPKRLGSVSAFVRAEVAADGVGISILEASGIASTFMETSGRLECFFEDGRPSEGPFDIVTTTTHTQTITGANYVADQLELLGPVERILSATGGTESCGNLFDSSVGLSSLFVLQGARIEAGGRTIAIDFNRNTTDRFGGTRVVTGRLLPVGP
jgi:hypothetical protein